MFMLLKYIIGIFFLPTSIGMVANNTSAYTEIISNTHYIKYIDRLLFHSLILLTAQ